MSTRRGAGRVRSAYGFIKAHRDQFPVQLMCRMLEVAPSGYSEWCQHPLSTRAQEDARLLRLIRASFTASHGIYGAPRVFLDLREAGETCSKHRVARLMRANDLRALHGYRVRRWAVGKPAVLIPNLLQRQFTTTRPNVAWVTDITYIRTWQGWLYLAVVLDLFSRRIVGWATAPTIHRELVLNAVLRAVRERRPRGTLIHSDQGTQFGSDAWRRFCRSHRLEPSMSRKGNCWDNAVAESFFSSLKKERIKKHIYKNRELALTDLAAYIEGFYNPTRRHSHLGGVSPVEFEAAHKRRGQRLH
ncbi:MAG: IS3 family transposase [Gemmatimonadetes bacterium]|nr:IS3 family transposase [Gemmatimonadota bacterium]